MPAYDFHTLSPADFEELTRDLLQAHLAIRLETFANGRDRGIDFRHAPASGGKLIVQSKHYARSGFEKLHDHLLRSEIAKVRRLNPDRYVLTTSVSLTPRTKERLMEVLSPFCREPGDILGLEDINNLLGMHPNLEVKHHKLWLTSSSVLERIVHGATFFQSAIEREEIERKLSLYVQTDAFGEALDLLQRFNYCIISGIPGIGKTTLAEILIVHLLEKGFELVVARADVREALTCLKPQKKQVVYYDDFLGQTSLGEKLAKNEDQNLVRLLSHAAQHPTKKVILTTREYILEQAKQLYERLGEADLEVAKCVVDLRHYTRSHRAKILYNHLYFSEIPQPYVDALVAVRGYRAIVDHRNYSPRIVEWMTARMGWRSMHPRAYADEFVASLDNPTRVWHHAYENQISANARHVGLALATLPNPTFVGVLERAWRALAEPLTSDAERHHRFLLSMRELDGTFVRTQRYAYSTAVDFHNPSIRDFLGKRIAADAALAHELVAKSVFFEQVGSLLCLGEEGRRSPKPTGLLSSLEVVGRALKRTLGGDSSELQRVRFSDGSQQYVIRARREGARIARVLRWARELRSGLLRGVAIEHLESRIHEQARDRWAIDDLCEAVDELLEDQRDDATLRLARRVVSLIDETIDSERSSIDEWGALGDLVHRRGKCFPELDKEDLAHRAETFCQRFVEDMIREAEDVEDLNAAADTVCSVADDWGFGGEGLAERLHEAALERAVEDEPPDDSRWERGGSGERDVTDAELDVLFASLEGAKAR